MENILVNTPFSIGQGESASIDSPKLRGIPTTPTPTKGDVSNQIANTKFVANAIAKASSSTGLVDYETIFEIYKDSTLMTTFNANGGMYRRYKL